MKERAASALTPRGWPVANMAWRIGEILDLDEQIEWMRRAGFDGAAFHASPGAPGRWRGADYANADADRRARLRERLRGFRLVEVHAPFELALDDERLEERVEQLCDVLDFAGDVGAHVCTIHALPPADAARWRPAMTRLNAAAERRGVAVGLELTGRFDLLDEWSLPAIGVTLDIGHMHLQGGKPLEPFNSIGDVIRRLAARLFHLHVHDYDGEHDHIALGAGRIDLDGVVAALQDIGYERGMTLELNPDRVSPEAMRDSLEWIRSRMRAPAGE